MIMLMMMMMMMMMMMIVTYNSNYLQRSDLPLFLITISLFQLVHKKQHVAEECIQCYQCYVSQHPSLSIALLVISYRLVMLGLMGTDHAQKDYQPLHQIQSITYYSITLVLVLEYQYQYQRISIRELVLVLVLVLEKRISTLQIQHLNWKLRSRVHSTCWMMMMMITTMMMMIMMISTCWSSKRQDRPCVEASSEYMSYDHLVMLTSGLFYLYQYQYQYLYSIISISMIIDTIKVNTIHTKRKLDNNFQ